MDQVLPSLHRAIKLHRRGKLDKAVRLYRSIVRQYPRNHQAQHLLGVAYAQRGQFAEAVPFMERALAINPDFAEAHYNLGNALQALGRNEDAVRCYEKVLALNPGYADAHYNLGNALLALDRHADAIQRYEKVLALNPAYPGAYNNLGSALKALDRTADAVRCFESAVQLAPDDAAVHFNLAVALQDLVRHDEAIARYDRTLALKPGDAAAKQNKGFSLLALERFTEGAPLYLDSWHSKYKVTPEEMKIPLWLGERDIRGKRLLVQQGGQGIGDAIQGARYVPVLQGMGAECWLQVHSRLMPLMTRSFPSARVVADDECPAGMDFRIPFMTNVLALRTRTVADIPRDCPYLAVDPGLVDDWRGALRSQYPMAVGVHWRGNPDNTNDRNRSMRLETLLPLFECGGVQFVSLQKDLTDAEIALLRRFPNVKIVDAEQTDFDVAAAVVAALDLTIAVDTAVAHLSGALGRRTWIMLCFAPDWRYFVDRADSPWYPAARLYRQRSFGDWTSVVAEVADSLRSSRGQHGMLA